MFYTQSFQKVALSGRGAPPTEILNPLLSTFVSGNFLTPVTHYLPPSFQTGRRFVRRHVLSRVERQERRRKEDHDRCASEPAPRRNI